MKRPPTRPFPPFPPLSASFACHRRRRVVRGVLKGFDQLVNIVLDNCVESMHGASARARFYFRRFRRRRPRPRRPPTALPPPADPDDPYRLTDKTRKLGLVVCRGLQVSLVSPVDGMEEIANPFIQHSEI